MRIFFVAIILAISGCSSNLQKLALQENQLKFEGFYSSYLALEYLEYSRSLVGNKQYFDGQYFAKKGLVAAKGYHVIPESPFYWKAQQAELEDLISAQKRYEKIATLEVKTLLPIQMAHLAFLYDCWVSKEAKPAFRLGELKFCKERFYFLLEEIEDFIADLGQDHGDKTKIVATEFARYLVFFDFDKYKINEKANRQIVNILNQIDKADGDYSLILIGNADRVGKELYNENLALKRVRVVEKYLLKNGVPKDVIEIRSFGEEFPDLITKDKTRQQFNRTVQVYLIKGAKSVRDIPLPVIMDKTYKSEIEKDRKKRGL